MFLPIIDGAIDIADIKNLMREELIAKKPKMLKLGFLEAVNDDLVKIREKRANDEALNPIMQPYEGKGLLGSIIERLQEGI